MAKLCYCYIFSLIKSLVIIMCIISASAELSRVLHDVRDGEALSFLVVGDWGRNGAFNQSQVAHQMGTTGEELNVDFIVSTGDNFYDDGLKSIVDPTFENSFTKVYTHNSLQKPWYSVLGNHDYRGNVLAQLSPTFRTIDERWFCLRSFIVSTEIAELFFVDTTPFVDKYFLKPKDHRYDWRGVLPRNKYLSTLLKDLDSALRSSVANWKIVVGHHPIESVGHHGGTKELVESLLPILEENNVDVYMNGHDHCLQHITSNRSPIEFITSGGGSKAWKGDFNTTNQEEVKFYYDGQGFISFQATQTSAVAAIYDIHGRVMHKLNLFKQPYSAQ